MTRVLLACALLPLAACFPTKTIAKSGPDTGARLLMLAGEEAAQVKVHGERLTRLLNVAHRQIQRGRGEDARVALRQARSTLQESPALEEHARMAAWVSLSELSRRARDDASAREAAAEAVKFLRGIEPAAKRTEYVRGLALELRYLEGEAAAVALLREAGPWAATLDDARRRRAFTAIAWDLFLCEDYEGGRDVLRRDPDAAWRSDTLTTLASIGLSYSHVQTTGLAMGVRGRAAAAPRARSFSFQASSESTGYAPAAVRWGKSINFSEVYLKK